MALRRRAGFGNILREFVPPKSLPGEINGVDDFRRRLRATVEICESRPTYLRLPEDRIVMPPVDWLSSDRAWRSCLLHELMHWSEWRRGWCATLARGELRAEIGQSLLEIAFGLPDCSDRTNFDKWIDIWLADLEAEPQLVSRMTEDAIDAAEFLLDCAAHCREQADADS